MLSHNWSVNKGPSGVICKVNCNSNHLRHKGIAYLVQRLRDHETQNHTTILTLAGQC